MDYQSLAEELLGALAYQRPPMEKPNQMSIGERGILNFLCFVRDGVLSGDLSRDVGLSTGRTATALKNLEKKGMVERVASQGDRRCVVVRITDAGRAAAESFRAQVVAHTEELLRRLGEADASEYVRIVKRLIAMQRAGEDAGDGLH